MNKWMVLSDIERSRRIRLAEAPHGRNLQVPAGSLLSRHFGRHKHIWASITHSLLACLMLALPLSVLATAAWSLPVSASSACGTQINIQEGYGSNFWNGS